jgi:thiol-disulfide isomerase/thioredoxin
MGQRTLAQRLMALAGIVVIVGVALAVLSFAGVLGNQGGGEGIESVELLDTPPAPARGDLDVGAEVGKLAPDFEISDFEGDRHRLSDFRGKVVYVNFWATWCGPCIEELPEIQALEDGNEDVVVITVNRRQPVEDAEQWLADLPNPAGGSGLSFTVDGIDPDDTLYDTYRGLGMPVSYFIDADGVVSSLYNGQISLEEMEAAVAQAVAESSSS